MGNFSERELSILVDTEIKAEIMASTKRTENRADSVDGLAFLSDEDTHVVLSDTKSEERTEVVVLTFDGHILRMRHDRRDNKFQKFRSVHKRKKRKKIKTVCVLLLRSGSIAIDDFFERIGVLSAMSDILCSLLLVEDESFRTRIIGAEDLEIAMLRCSAVLSEDDAVVREASAARACEADFKHNGKIK